MTCDFTKCSWNLSDVCALENTCPDTCPAHQQWSAALALERSAANE